VLYGLIDAAYKEGYAAYPSKGPSPYFNIDNNHELVSLEKAWNEGWDAAYSDELEAYMEGLSRLNSNELDAASSRKVNNL
jgi:hypothetical protein